MKIAAIAALAATVVLAGCVSAAAPAPARTVYVKMPGPVVTKTVPGPVRTVRVTAPATSAAAPASGTSQPPAAALGFPGVTAGAAPGVPVPSINGATWAVTINCTGNSSCQNVPPGEPGAGPDDSTCGPLVGEEQVCVG
jgi:hypothetical protein